MKLKLCICYHVDNISNGKVFHALDFYVLNGMVRDSMNFGRSKANRIGNGSNIYGVSIYENIEVHETSEPFIIFSKEVEKPVYKSRNQIISPVDYCWHIAVDKVKGSTHILDGKYCYDVSAEEKEIKKEKITQNIEPDSEQIVPQKDEKIESEDILNPLIEFKKKIETKILKK